MPVSDKRQQVLLQYARTHLKRIPFDVQKEKYEEIRVHAEKRGEKINSFIKRAIDETMERDVLSNRKESDNDEP